MAARTLIGDAVPPGAERAVHDALDTGAIQRDECMWANGILQQMSHTTQIAGSLLADGRGKQDRPPGRDPRAYECLGDGDERCEAAGIVGDAGPFQPHATARHRHVEIGAEHGV